MGWFSAETRGDSIRSGSAIPTRAERAQCWTSRDLYYACLDRNNIVDALANPSATAKVCPSETAGFERDCAKEWVKYFKQWRVADYKKKKRIEDLKKEGAAEVVGLERDLGVNLGEKGKGMGKEDIQSLLDKKRR